MSDGFIVIGDTVVQRVERGGKKGEMKNIEAFEAKKQVSYDKQPISRCREFHVVSAKVGRKLGSESVNIRTVREVRRASKWHPRRTD